MSEDALRIHDSNHSGEQVPLYLDDRPLSAHAGENVAAALFASGVRALCSSPRLRQARGMFCMTGWCQECLVMIDGRRSLACQIIVTAGMRIETVPQISADV
jgi:predicted molibdopterin-dependent oxidoreductase YjgC